MKSWKSAGTANSALLLDTNVLLWVGLDDPRLSRSARAAIAEPSSSIFVSAVTAYEFEDLRLRGRLGPTRTVSEIVDRLGASVLDYPAEVYRIAALMPRLHRDPVDRMLIAHALHADMTMVTADAMIRRYPVRTLW